MEAFTRIENKSLSGMIKSRIKSAVQRRFDYWNILFNCVRNSFEHNDVSWVNKGLQMAKAVGRYKATVRILKNVVPFAFDSEAQIFHGKMKEGMYNKLSETYSEVLLALVNEQQVADSTPKEKKEWEFDTARENFEKACATHGYEVKVTVKNAVKAAA